MKTFSEACLATFMRKTDNPAQHDSAVADIEANLPRWAAIQEEVQTSREAHMLVLTMHDWHRELEIPIDALIRAAFAHGVVVGMEMEKMDDA